ncbi:MAG TPA: MFS transporter [Acidimicrobiales bacterium]|nr:MFS transporter [Acidimicrobiales bacterium]
MGSGSHNGAPPQGISTPLVALLSVACGVSAAGLYYAQPLLQTIARAFGTTAGAAALVVTLSQVGYAVGLALLVPAGDLLDRRRMAPAVLLVSAAALAASAVVPGMGALVGAAFVVGLGAVAAQILVPFAASLATDEARGRVTGTVMSGLLLGILLARTVSGAVAGAFGWRVVYWAAAVVVTATAAALWRALPADRHQDSLPYLGLLRSNATLWTTEPLLRWRMVLGALCFACFSVFWTTAAFLLAGPPYHYGDTVIGLFGLVGAAGALCATFAGRLADRGHTSVATFAFSGLLVVSFVMLLGGRHRLGLLIAGIVVLDVGVQGLHITNQSLVFRLPAQLRSRVNSNYMVAYFAGGAVGSALSGAVYAADGWTAVCALGAACGLLAVAAWAYGELRRIDLHPSAGAPRRPSPRQPSPRR